MTVSTRRVLPFLFALVLVLAGTPSASATSTRQVAGLTATIHGAAQLELSGCVYPAAAGGALVLAFIDNPGATSAPSFSVTLHAANGELLAERTFGALQPGDSKTFAVRLSVTEAQSISVAEAVRCD